MNLTMQTDWLHHMELSHEMLIQVKIPQMANIVAQSVQS